MRYFLSVRGAEEADIETGVIQAGREIVRAAVTSAVIREVGRRRVDDVLREDLAGLRRAVEESSQEILDELDCGIGISNLDIVKMIPPQAVQQAFDDTFLAGQEANEKVNEAISYRSRILSEAAGSAGEGIASVIADVEARREAGEDTGELEAQLDELLQRAGGEAARVMSEAEAYRQGMVARAEADARYLTDILSEYKGKPKMMRLFLRDQLLEVTEQVMATAERKWVVPSGGRMGASVKSDGAGAGNDDAVSGTINLLGTSIVDVMSVGHATPESFDDVPSSPAAGSRDELLIRGGPTGRRLS